MLDEQTIHTLEIRVAKLESQIEDFIKIRTGILQLVIIGAIAGLLAAFLKLLGFIK